MPAGIKTVCFAVLEDKHAEMTAAAKAFGSLGAYFEALHDQHVKSSRKNSKAK